MVSITITGKRRWSEDGQEFLECYANGVRIAERWKAGFLSEEDAERRVKNMCKLIKLFGVDMPTSKEFGVLNYQEREAFEQEELPEWDEKD